MLLLSDFSAWDQTMDRSTCSIAVLMPQRSLIIVGGDARYKWNHAIHRKHISKLRMAMTLRELTAEFLPGGPREGDGRALIDIANSYDGVVVK